MQHSKTISILLVIFLFSISSNSYSVEFQECEKFSDKNGRKYIDCLNYSFSEAVVNSQFGKINKRLENHTESNKYQYSDYLTILMCGNHANMVEGEKPFKTKNRKEIIKVTDRLLKLGASFESMPTFSIVTPLFCLSNRKDSKILGHVLKRIKATKKDLDGSLYEGTDPAHVPLYRAILNNDLESAKVLVKHGASPDYSNMYNETTLKTALEKDNIKIANWLLDIGASVHKRDEKKGCSGKSALDYALEIPESVKGKKQIISRIKKLMLLPSPFLDNCNKKKHNKLLKN